MPLSRKQLQAIFAKRGRDKSQTPRPAPGQWAPSADKTFRAEVERRFRARTPAKDILDASIADRVNRSEMRTWAMEQFGALPPEMDVDWLEQHARWYRQMALRVLKELDPEMVPVYKAHLRRHPVKNR